MQCVQFETRLNELLDERLSPELEPAIGWHAGECARCAALLAAHEDLLAGVESLKMSAATPDLAVRVAGELSRRRILAAPRGGGGSRRRPRPYCWGSAHGAGPRPARRAPNHIQPRGQTCRWQCKPRRSKFHRRARWRPACRRMPCPQARGRQSLGRQSLGRQRPPARESFRFGWLRIRRH